MHFQPVAIQFEPSPDILIFVVGSVVLNQDRTLTPVSPRKLFHESQICAGVEYTVALVVEGRLVQFDRAKDLHALSLAGDGYLRRMPYATPRCVQCGILPEAGFVGEDQCPVFPEGFFLRFGYVRRRQRS